MSCVRDLLDEGARALPGDEARREAALLLRHALGASDAWLVAHATDPVDPVHEDVFHDIVARRARGEPIAYLIGTRGFHTLDLQVTPAVLIPRPETELLADSALRRIPADADCAGDRENASTGARRCHRCERSGVAGCARERRTTGIARGRVRAGRLVRGT